MMNKKGPIIVLEDDGNAQDLSLWKGSINWNQKRRLVFQNENQVHEYQDKTEVPPFLILTNINLPKINGF